MIPDPGVSQGRICLLESLARAATLRQKLHIEGSGPEWYIHSMLYSRDIPFWCGTLAYLWGDAWCNG